MRKLLAFLVLLMLPWVARGQALADWYYWFDQDETPQESGKIDELMFHLQPDVSRLKTGLHTLYVQVVDTAGAYSTPVGTMFYKVSQNTQPTEFRYWFDSDATLRTMPYGQGHYILDVANLSPGFHFVNYYVADGEKNMTKIDKAGFFRLPMASNQKLHYWFAGDTVATHVPNFQDGFIVDVTRLMEGFNTIYFQIDENGPTDIMTERFIKIPQTENGGDMTLVCIIDGKVVGEEKVAAHGGVVKCDMDVSNMEVGLHKAMFQLITPSGSGSSIAETYFIRTLTNDDVASMQCSYTIDGFKHYTHKGTLTNGTFHFDLPVEDVEEGLHRIDYMLVAENGASTTQGSAWFFKTPVGGNGITQYDYWLNDKSDEVRSVTLDEPTDPFQLVKLLPVSSEPLRTSCFHFEVKDGKPMMYAKNDIHFRFHDKSGRWVDADKQYVDYNTSEVVTDIAELQSTQTFERPDENGVKWFRFDAEYGDSIALKSSQASSVQVFNAAGNELYSASGSNSVNFGGCHVFEDGTFYVAIHDVTGSAQNITLESKMIEKFCVFEYTPDRMADVGKTLISMKGNGLNYVKSIELYNEDSFFQTDTIVQSMNELLARIELNIPSTTNSKYSLRVFFCNEEKNESKTIELKDVITVEPVQKGDIVVEVKRENRVGDPYPIRVIVRNTGNTSCYATPMNIAFDHVENFDDVYFMDFNLLLSEPLYESRDFFTYTDNLVGTGKKGLFIPMLLPYLGPYEEVTYTLGIKTKIPHANINLYAWAGEPWYDSSLTAQEFSRSNIRRAPSNNPCGGSSIPPVSDMFPNANTDNGGDNGDDNGNGGDTYNPDNLYGPGNIADDLTDFPIGPGQLLSPFLGTAEAIGGIIQGSSRMNEDALAKMGAVPMGEDIGQYRYQYRYNPRSPREIAHDANPLFAKPRVRAAGRASSGRRSIEDYASGDCDSPTPNSVNPWIPGDPNDITGYLTESGSHYINAEVVNVGYDIEFENDPEIANASAHHIVIRDTLDARLFDFNTFVPKTVKISGKEVELDGTYPFVKSLDMRPEIYSIAELRGDFDKKTGIATWDLIALDPMTMEPTDDIMQGILPVNTYDGNGIGNVTYTINLKQGLAEGTEIPNRAGIVFDFNDPIMTPTWVNTIDATSPTSHVTNVEMKNDSTFTINFEGEDNLSGVWHYDVYYRWKDNMDWVCIANGCDSTAFDKTAAFGYKYEFCVVATDSAGNVEQKELTPEFEFYTGLLGDVNKDGEVTVADVSGAVSIILEEPGTEAMNAMAADVNRDGNISVADASGIVSIILGLPLESKARRVMATRGSDLLDIAPIAMDYGETLSVPVSTANGNSSYVAMQFDLTLPQGVELVGVKGTNEHSCRMATLASGKKRIVCLSQRNETMTAQSLILVLKSSDKAVAGTIDIDGIELVGTKMNALHPEAISIPICVGDATSIDIVNGDGQDGTTYDLNGRKVKDAQKGVYIQDGKPVYIDK